METVTILLVLAVFIAVLYGLWTMQKKHVAFSKRVFTGLGAGVVFGAVLQLLFGAEGTVTSQAMEWISLVGTGYVRFLQMLIMPLVFVSIIRAFTKIEGTKNLGKISATVLTTLLATTAVAALLGILSVMLFNLDGAEFVQGAAEAARIQELQESQQQVADLTIADQLVNFIPTNFFEDLAGLRDTSVISVVIFSAFVGMAYLGVRRKDPENGEMFERIIGSVYAIVMRIVTLVLRLAPYGIFALMTRALATSSFQALINLAVFVIASYAAIIVMFLLHMLILAAVKVNPVQYLKKAWPVLGFAFSSRSSAGALPLNIEIQRHALGVDDASANFAGTFGLSIGQNGCAGIYPAMLAAIVAPSVGMDLFDPITILTIVAVVTISSFGVAGVGGGATFAALIVLGTLGMPVTIVGLVISVEPIIDMARTMLNVNDSILAGVVSSRRIGEFDDAVLNDESAIVSSDM
ncbi:L-cystine transporter [Atopococcus tabaci]|uniref:L-cystine transporter n=1 Tax=Atopococcus tabaci TaxID=269774 RepID=UPI00240A3C98|nr:cation:dicarboxylase symporter family transporter [Atopococcus tabaci]